MEGESKDTENEVESTEKAQIEQLIEVQRDTLKQGFLGETVNKDLKEIDQKMGNRTWIQRTFGPMSPGSLRGCIFNLFILTLGTGCLSIPQKISYMSLVLTVIVIILAGLANMWTFMLISSIAIDSPIRNYAELVKSLYGKCLSVFLDVIMIIDRFGITTVYLVIIYKIVGSSIYTFGYTKKYKTQDDFLKHSFWGKTGCRFGVSYGIVICICLPLCLLKDISKMRFSSSFGILSSVILILIVLIQFPFFFHEILTKPEKKEVKKAINIIDLSVIKHGVENFFKSFATLFYAYSCQLVALPIMTALANPTKKRVNKVWRRTFILAIIFYTVIGVSGYLTCPLNPPDLIIDREPIKRFHKDIIMTLGKIFLCVTLLMKIPVDYNSLRISVLNLMNKNSNNFSNILNFIITIITLFIATLISVLYTGVTNYMSLIGGFTSVAISFFIPGLLYVKGNKLPKYHINNILTLIGTMTLSIIGVVSGILTIKSMVDEKKKK